MVSSRLIHSMIGPPPPPILLEPVMNKWKMTCSWCSQASNVSVWSSRRKHAACPTVQWQRGVIKEVGRNCWEFWFPAWVSASHMRMNTWHIFAWPRFLSWDFSAFPLFKEVAIHVLNPPDNAYISQMDFFPLSYLWSYIILLSPFTCLHLPLLLGCFWSAGGELWIQSDGGSMPGLQESCICPEESSLCGAVPGGHSQPALSGGTY